MATITADRETRRQGRLYDVVTGSASIFLTFRRKTATRTRFSHHPGSRATDNAHRGDPPPKVVWQGGRAVRRSCRGTRATARRERRIGRAPPAEPRSACARPQPRGRRSPTSQPPPPSSRGWVLRRCSRPSSAIADSVAVSVARLHNLGGRSRRPRTRFRGGSPPWFAAISPSFKREKGRSGKKTNLENGGSTPCGG